MLEIITKLTLYGWNNNQKERNIIYKKGERRERREKAKEKKKYSHNDETDNIHPYGEIAEPA
jgi:hypothetical protein